MKPLRNIIERLQRNQIGNSLTYVGKDYTKTDLIADLSALRANYPYSSGDIQRQMMNEVKLKPKKSKINHLEKIELKKLRILAKAAKAYVSCEDNDPNQFKRFCALDDAVDLIEIK